MINPLHKLWLWKKYKNTITVHVTQEDIDEGSGVNSQDCPCYRAMVRAGLPVSVVGTDIFILKDGTRFTLPKQVSENIVQLYERDALDRQINISPFSFEVEIPKGN